MKILLSLLIICASILKAQNNTRITSYYDSNDKKTYYLTWDIKTGKSIQYYWDTQANNWAAFEINIPDKPVAGALGNIMFDVYFDYKDSKAYYIAWDTKTGKSVEYLWDGQANKWLALEINLPANPIPGATGEIMIKGFYSTDDNKGYYIVYDTNGGRSVQYYWDEPTNKWQAFEINLPKQPLLKK